MSLNRGCAKRRAENLNDVLTIHNTMQKLGLTLATAESCTGGWIAKLLTDVSGSSAYFKGGAVVYSNAAKRNVLRVAITDNESAATKKVAESMSRNALRVFKTDFAVATTGFMESTPELVKKHYTGECFVSVAFKRGASVNVRSRKIILRGTRRQNRVSASNEALDLVIRSIRVFTQGS